MVPLTVIGKSERNSGEQKVGDHEVNFEHGLPLSFLFLIFKKLYLSIVDLQRCENTVSLRGPLAIQMETRSRQLEFEKRCRLKRNIWESSAYRRYLKLGNG